MVQSIYPAKVLLLGEYSIIDGSMGLSLPFDLFGGSLQFPTNVEDKEQIKASSKGLRELASHIAVQIQNGKLRHEFDLDSMRFELEEQLFFRSTIPQGAGLGSSGALCAAVFDRYARGVRQSDLEQVKDDLAIIESFYHGSSSGLDPLLCLCRKPLLIQGKERLLELDQNFVFDARKKYHLFLLSSPLRRKTEPLVACYTQKKKEDYFAQMLDGQLIPACNRGVEACLAENGEELWQSVLHLSSLQKEYFSEMIPEALLAFWQGKHHALKLCGAGGGGFFLGISDSLESLKKEAWYDRIKLLASFLA